MARSRSEEKNPRLRKEDLFFLLRTYDATYHFLALGLKHHPCLASLPLCPDEQRMMCLNLGIEENSDYERNIPEEETKVYMNYVAGLILFSRDIANCEPSNKIRCFIFEINREQGRTGHI